MVKKTKQQSKKENVAGSFPLGVAPTVLALRFPRLYHMAEVGSWPSIQKHGLLSTSALLDLFAITGEERRKIEACHRPNSVTIKHPVHGSAVIRDQKPMDDSGLTKALNGDATPEEWYRLLNSKVFFWVSKERLETLLDARAYRDKRQTILTVETLPLVSALQDQITLCPINSGATKPNPHPRTRASFQPLDKYPLAEWDHKRKRREPVVELAVTHAVPRIADYVLGVEEVGAGKAKKVIFKKK